jgi:hypothetical protein
MVSILNRDALPLFIEGQRERIGVKASGNHVLFCLTSKMSHAGIWRAACLNRNWIRILHFETHEVARGVTDVGVGSGALLGGLGSLPRNRPRISIKAASVPGWIL